MTSSARLMYENREEEWLAGYAVKSSESRGRKYPEKEHGLRTVFQRDRDRIIHSTAFRRLQYKTQVFVNDEGDHYRTRLTHTLEACQIARTIARVLRLNEDLVETIALAHDLGHGPFGHAGEWALGALMKDYGGFEHNNQSLRIVEELEESYVEFPGLNLTFETVEGLKKHPEKLRRGEEKTFRSLEADLVDLADEIAYNTHDLDDGLRSGLLGADDVRKIEFWRRCSDYIHKKYKNIAAYHQRRLTIRLMINRLVMDVIEQSQKRINAFDLSSIEKVQGLGKPVIVFSDEVKKLHGELKRSLHRGLYQHSYVVAMTDKGKEYIKGLFKAYTEKPALLPAEIHRKIKVKNDVYRVVCDYIAGMTDRFATEEHGRIVERSAK